jgi:hypothetical protein
MYKAVLKGININKLRDGVMLWDHRVRLFSHYMRYTKAELVEKILELQYLRVADEMTLEECIMLKVYGMKPKPC